MAHVIPSPSRATAAGEVRAALADDGQLPGSGFLDQMAYMGRVLSRHMVLFMFVVGLGLGSGYAWLNHQTPVYRAKARVLIEPNAPKLLNLNEVVELGVSGSSKAMFFSSQYQIIKSRDVSERVMDRLGLWDRPETLLPQVQWQGLAADERMSLMKSLDLPGVLAERIVVQPVKGSMVVDVLFEHEDRELSIAVVNTVAEAYLEQNLDRKKETVAAASRDLAEVSKSWQDRLDEAEAEIEAFHEATGVGISPIGRKNIQEQLRRINLELSNVRVERIRIESLAMELEEYRGDDDIDLDRLNSKSFVDNPVVRKLKQMVASASADLSSARAKYLTQHPDVRALKRKRDSLHASLRHEIESIANSAQVSLERIQEIEAQLMEEHASLEAEERRLAQLTRDHAQMVDRFERTKSQHDTITNREIETTLSAQVATNNARLLDPAVRADRVWPKTTLAMLAIFILSLFLGIGSTYVADNMDRSISDIRDLERVTGTPVIGTLPAIGPERTNTRRRRSRSRYIDEHVTFRDLYVMTHPYSYAAEAARIFRTNLQVRRQGLGLKTILVTSAEAEAGKTTVAVAMATASASNDMRVLLVEANMRRPRLANTFHLSLDRGLSSVLNNPESDIDAHIQQTLKPNMDVLPCGPIPSNPTELLDGPRFDAFIDAVSERYDLVIVDAPPVLAVADALVLASKLDGCLMVARSGLSTRQSVAEMVRLINSIEGRPVGAVLNALPVHRTRFLSPYVRETHRAMAIMQTLVHPSMRG